jgi:methyl-accepting chemotaxis protein
METSIVSIISDLAVSGILTDTSLLIIIISILVLSYKYFIIPLLSKVSEQPTTEDLTSILQNSNDIIESQIDEVNEISIKLEKLLDKIVGDLDEVYDLSKNNTRDVTEIRSDAAQIKQILNQFQGHMMYSNSQSRDFGNRELK